MRHWNGLTAAVVRAEDPLSDRTARVVPEAAQIIALGGVVLGYEHSPARFQTPKKRTKSWYEVAAIQRRNELRNLLLYRYGRNSLRAKYDLGPPHGWLIVMSNLLVCLDREITVVTIQDLAATIGYRENIDPLLIEVLARDTKDAAKLWRRYEILSPDHCGRLLEVTSVEREEAGLRKIGSIDETGPERKKRLDRERAATARKKAGAKSRRKTDSGKAAAERLGISRATYFRRKKSGSG